MNLTLSAIEARILGCLIEKQATTPDVYPLTLNSLVLACNQKSNREPVMNLDETDVMSALDTLAEKTLASTWQSGRSRIAKYQHRLHQRAFDEFNFSRQELAVLGLLFLRGPQTAGEIRTRCARIHEFPDLDAVIEVLKELEAHPDGPYVTMLARRPGHKESRYAHLFCGEVEEYAAPEPTAQANSSGHTRLEEMEQEITELSERLLTLEQRFAEFVEQFE